MCCGGECINVLLGECINVLWGECINVLGGVYKCAVRECINVL